MIWILAQDPLLDLRVTPLIPPPGCLSIQTLLLDVPYDMNVVEWLRSLPTLRTPATLYVGRRFVMVESSTIRFLHFSLSPSTPSLCKPETVSLLLGPLLWPFRNLVLWSISLVINTPGSYIIDGSEVDTGVTFTLAAFTSKNIS